MSERYLKQCIIVRKDLTMPTGKMAAMVAHAAMTFMLTRLKSGLQCPDLTGEKDMIGVMKFTDDEYQWLTELDPGIEETGQLSMAKIVLQVSSEEELLEVETKAKDAQLTVHRVVDSGSSHNKPGTLVCIAIGPHWPEVLEPVTGTLKVYR